MTPFDSHAAARARVERTGERLLKALKELRGATNELRGTTVPDEEFRTLYRLRADIDELNGRLRSERALKAVDLTEAAKAEALAAVSGERRGGEEAGNG
jgi:hypothetical protein